MTAQPEHDTWAAPTWTVQAVFGDGDGPDDFAYTVGLDDRGQPEVHMRCRPGLGDDPAPDWRFSDRDMCGILNEVGRRLIAGSARVGDEWEHRYDDGLVTVRFRLDGPGDRDELEAYGIAPAAVVLPLRWSLHRASRGTRRPLDPEERRSAVRTLVTLQARVASPARVPRRWRPPFPRKFGPAQRYGPRTQLVRARAASIWSADAETLTALLVIAAFIEQGGARAGWPSAGALAQARPLGLDDALEALRSDVHEAAHLVHPGRTATAWESVVSSFADPFRDNDRTERKRLSDNLIHLFADVVTAGLMMQALGTDARESMRVAALGPWLCASLPEGMPPGPEWHATPVVLERLETAVVDLSGAERARLGDLHDRAYGDDPEYAHVVGKLLGWAITSPAGSPPLPGLPPSWSSAVTAALTHRMRLTAADVDVLARPVRALLPDLAELLNEPL